jgi:hypothetical protein
MADGQIYPKCFGPYLRYAISTRFVYFSSFGQTISRRDQHFFNESEFKLFLLVEFIKAGQAEDFADAIQKILSDRGVELGPAADDTPYTTMRTLTIVVTPAAADSSGSSIWQHLFALWEEYVSRVELSLPMKLSTEMLVRGRVNTLEERWKEEGESPRSLLIGMLDDGCPFAAAPFRRTSSSGSTSTRVRAIWDQDQNRRAVTSTNIVFGQEPPDFKYGLEYRRHSEPLGGPLPRQIGLDEWTTMHLTPGGSVDEDGCYANAEFKRLASQQSHGAHVMDVLAGSVPTSSRIGPSKVGGDRRDPPSWAPGNAATDPACDADVVFVQFPENCIRDATGVWLLSYVVDGIRYILSFADPDHTDHVIINLSYGPTTGPHDGKALLEAALTALVAEYNGTHRKPKLEIILAAGNAYLSEGHFFFASNDEDPAQVEWTWRLPPDNAVLCFAEIWMDEPDASSVSITLTSPSGVIYTPASTTPPPPAGVDLPITWGGQTMWRLHVDHTRIAPGITAPESGDYKISITGVPENAKVHGYVARTDPNMGVRNGAKHSYFVDPNWEQTRSAFADCTRVNGEFDKSGSLVHRHGTLNGIATAKKRRVHVAGGYVLADGRKSTYSSAGPARHGPRVGPDYLLPCDESCALEGIRAGGTRSGAVFRLVGTSVAAPELGRQIVKLVSGLPFPTPTHVPTGTDIEKRGGGNIEPP